MSKGVGKKYRFKPRFILIVVVVLLAITGAVLFSQEQKLSAIDAQKQVLTDEYDDLLNEKQRLEYMIEYSKTDEYLIQYAREKLGFVAPDDIKFDIKK